LLAYLKIILHNQNEEILITWKFNCNSWWYISFYWNDCLFYRLSKFKCTYFFYGVPIFLIGLGLKTSEIPPVKLFDKTNFATNKFNRPKELTALVKDVTRWRYGIKAHLESSLESLNLWDEDNPPQLKEIEEITKEEKNGLRMRFELNAVPLEKWIEKQERLNRFFVKGLESEFIIDDNKKEFDFILFY